MLSESMLQRFSTKIGQLVSTQQAERSGSPPQTASFEKQRRSQDGEAKKKQRESSPSSSYEENNLEVHEQSKKSSNSASMNENEESEKAEKINNKQLSRLIALEKQKSQMGGVKCQRIIPSTVKKTVGVSPVCQTPVNLIPKQPPQASHSSQTKSNIQMPKVSVMNNLLKLSTKLQSHQLLKLIKYQALVLSMASARFLLYFCIEKLIFSIYLRQGAEKMQQKQKDIPFYLKNIQQSLIEVILYFKKLQRSMLTRILQAVFHRFQISSCFSEKWLTQCIKENKKVLQDNYIDAEDLEKIPANSSITSNIFLGIPSQNQKMTYDFPHLELEDEEYSQEKIQDPQVFHSEQKLFFYKKSFNKDKFTNKIIKNQVQIKRQKPNVVVPRGPIYNVRKFEIELPKLTSPSWAKIYRSLESIKDDEIENKISETCENDRSQMRAHKRNRNIVLEDLQEQEKTDKQKPKVVSKDRIAKAIQDYIFANITQIVTKIADKLSMDAGDVMNQVKQMGYDGRPTKKRNNAKKISEKNEEKEQCDSEIIKEIESRSIELQSRNVSHKELVKEIFKLLQNKSLSHERKEDIMEKWIAYKRQKKSGRK